MTQQTKVVSRFTKRLNNSVDYHRELLLALHGKTREAALESMLVEQFVLYIAVLWELFISDLILTYLAMSPGAYVSDFKRRVGQSMKERFGAAAAKYTVFTARPNLSRAAIEALLDPKGFNVAAQSADQLVKRANMLLAAQYAKKFTMTQEDAQFIDFLIALRNYLGHRSKGSRASLRAAVEALTGVNAPLNATFKDVAVYLKTHIGPDQRAIVIAQRLVTIAGSLG